MEVASSPWILRPSLLFLASICPRPADLFHGLVGGIGVALGWLWGRKWVAIGWLTTSLLPRYYIATSSLLHRCIWLSGGFGVALRWHGWLVGQLSDRRIRESSAERRFPNRLTVSCCCKLSTKPHTRSKPVWKPALRRSFRDSLSGWPRRNSLPKPFPEHKPSPTV
jgi:hypothetical protein